MRCDSCFNRVEEAIGNKFSAYGRFVARHPWKVMLIGILVNGLLGIGMLKLDVVIDVDRVYTPIGSQASEDADKVRSLFPDTSGSNFNSYQMPDLGRYGEVIVIPKAGDILNSAFLTQLSNLYNYMLAIGTTDGDGTSVTLQDICAESYGNCAIDGSIFVDTNFVSDVTGSVAIPYPSYNHPTFGPVYYAQLIGGAVVSPSNTLTSANMLILRVNLRTDSEYYKQTAKNWQDSFLNKMQNYSSNDFDIFYSHRDSLSEELNENVNGDITLFSVTFTIIITYACIATMTARCDVVGQKSNLGYAGVIAAGLAIVAAFGVGSACGVEFVSIVGVVPFLIIGIGVDDMFMLMSGIINSDYTDTVEDRIGQTMKTSGVSITITSLTDLLAFAAGASSVFLSVRNFCIYCAIAVVFCYLNQATIFLACIAINEKRTEDNRHFATCFQLPEPEDVDDTKVSSETAVDLQSGSSDRLSSNGIRLHSSNNSNNKVHNGTDGAVINSNSDSSNKVHPSKCFTLCCSGRKPKKAKEAESWLDKVPKWLIPKITIPFPAKCIILVVFAAYLGVSIWGCTRLEQGLDLKDLVSRNSYYYEYRDRFDTHFPGGTPVSLVLEETVIYSDTDIQNKIDSLLSTIMAEETVLDSFSIDWLTAYKASASYVSTTEAAFITGLQTFLSDPQNARYRNDVVINNSNTSITASRFHVMSESIKHSQDQGDFMLQMRELVSKSSLPAFAFSSAFLYYEQYVVILSQTLQTLGIAVAMVFVVTCIFMPHPLMLLYITATVAMITVGIVGFISFLGLTLSAITMIHVIMSIGFSVDFAAHICHGYMISEGKDRNEKMKTGIERSGAPIFHGAISSILGVLMLAFAKSFIFYSFFQVMSLVITFGILHALLLLPVVLSLIGPFSMKSADEESPTKSNVGDTANVPPTSLVAFTSNDPPKPEIDGTPNNSPMS